MPWAKVLKFKGICTEGLRRVCKQALCLPVLLLTCALEGLCSRKLRTVRRDTTWPSLTDARPQMTNLQEQQLHNQGRLGEPKLQTSPNPCPCVNLKTNAEILLPDRPGFVVATLNQCLTRHSPTYSRISCPRIGGWMSNLHHMLYSPESGKLISIHHRMILI